jgi:hypothetical protein
VDFRKTLEEVGGRLDARGCRWAVIGGVALGVYGVPRATVDVDLLLDASCAERLEELLADLPYELNYRWEESSHFAPTSAECCPLDVLHAHRPHSLAMLSRARRVPLPESDLAIPVVELEDLFGLKVQAMINDPDRRRGELVDMRALLEAAAARHEPVDLARIREYFVLFSVEHELEELLQGVSDAFV